MNNLFIFSVIPFLWSNIISLFPFPKAYVILWTRHCYKETLLNESALPWCHPLWYIRSAPPTRALPWSPRVLLAGDREPISSGRISSHRQMLLRQQCEVITVCTKHCSLWITSFIFKGSSETIQIWEPSNEHHVKIPEDIAWKLTVTS